MAYNYYRSHTFDRRQNCGRRSRLSQYDGLVFFLLILLSLALSDNQPTNKDNEINELIANDKPTNLEEVTDDELLNLFRTENYVVVLFSKSACKDCDKFEQSLARIREDIVESIGAWVVKAVESHLVKFYSPEKEPALVFFRSGIPLLYDGEINDDLILHTLTQNKEPTVKELTDETFEHLTQAASGATTGDWFVMFYSNDCIDCQRLQARWEAVGANLKSRMNVARVNRVTTGAITARRFRIPSVPYFMLFRLGKMYHYTVPKHDIQSFTTFATEWFRNEKAEKVPVPKTPFDDLTLMIADYIRENQWLLLLFAVTIMFGILLSVYVRLKTDQIVREVTKSKSKPETTDKAKKSK